MITKAKINQLFTPEQLSLFNSKDSLAMFLAQLDYESAGFTILQENLNYSGKRLLQIFPKYFDAKLADEYEFNPTRIANRVYANRMGNGDENSGDGYIYRGRGYIQLTGKSNYIEAGIALNYNFEQFPDAVIQVLSKVAIWYFQKHNILNNTDINIVTHAINGGLNGLQGRQKLLNYYQKLLT